MTDQSDIKFFNFLVHYGKNSDKHLKELIEEALINVLSSPEHLSLVASKTIRIIKLHKIVKSKKIYLTGLFYKTAKVNWETIPDDDDNPIDEPGSKNVMPYARFILSVGDHRLLWITKRGLTKSPTQNDFIHFIKKKSLVFLRQKYRDEADEIWEENSEELIETGFKNKVEFKRRYLHEQKISYKLLQVRTVPEISSEDIYAIIDKKENIVTNAVFYPHMNNVKTKHCIDLITNADEIAKEGESEAEVVLKPISSKNGIKKSMIKRLLEITKLKRLARFKLTIKSTEAKSKPISISTNNDKNETEYSKVGTINSSPKSPEFVKLVFKEFSDVVENAEPVDDLDLFKDIPNGDA